MVHRKVKGCVWPCLYSGVGRGNGSDLRVKVILKKKLVFKCVCAKQEGCTVSIKRSGLYLIPLDNIIVVFIFLVI